MTYAELIAKVIQSNAAGAKLLLKDYKNVELSVNGDELTRIQITQPTITYAIEYKRESWISFVTLIVYITEQEPYQACIEIHQPFDTLVQFLNTVPGIDIIMEPRTIPTFDVLYRYAYKVHEYCKQVTGCNNCDFDNKPDHCPFRRHDDVGLCPSEWEF